MQAVTLKDAKRNLPRLVEQVLADAEPRIVVTDTGGSRADALDKFNSWKETLYLLGNPANAAPFAVRSRKPSQGKRSRGAGPGMNLTFTPSRLGRLPNESGLRLGNWDWLERKSGSESASKTAPTSTEKPGSKFEAANCPRR